MTKDEIEALKEKIIFDFEEEREGEIGHVYALGLCHAIDYLAERGLLGGVPDGWNNLYETMPPIDKEFVCRHKCKPHIQFEAIITMESEGYFSADGGKPYPVLWNFNDDTDILDAPWAEYEWMPLPAAQKGDAK